MTPDMNKKEIHGFIENLKFPLGLGVIAILFHNPIEQVVNKFLVIPILSSVMSNWITNLIFFTLLIIIAIDFYKKYCNNYQINHKTFIYSSILILFYFYYRIWANIWDFTGFNFVESIKYLDILMLFFLSNFLLKILHTRRGLLNMSDKGFYLDNPLGLARPDLLNRENLAKHISKEIEATVSSESSFAIGISSEWGNGKTSFFDLLERHLNTDLNIIVKVNPWINHDSKNIVKDFFNALGSRLSKYNSGLSPIIKKYAEILVGIGDENINKILNPLLNSESKNETIISEFEQINSVIKSLDKKLVVFIDDLDRLYKEEIIEVVKLIRNSANFGNTVFIVAYDRNYIINAIKDINNYNPEYFLEKIFQLEIRLPNFEEQIIQKRIYELISPRVTDSDKVELLDILLKKKHAFDTNVFNSGTLTTLRDATRFSNSFLIAYNYLKGEIVLSDLLNLEALRLKYPGVYKLIFFQSDEYLETTSNTSQKTYYSLRTEKNEGNETDKVLIRDYLEQNFEKVGMPKYDIDKAIRLLYSLFPSQDSLFYNRNIELLSVSNPSSFERYSHYRLLDNNVSEIEFSQYRAKSLDEFCEKINEWVEKGQRWELKRRFENINAFSDKNDFEKVINAIFFFARLPDVENIENDYSGYDFDNLFAKLKRHQVYIKLKYYENEADYKDFVLSIFKNAPSPYTFDIDFIYTAFDKYSITYDFIVPENEFDQLRLEYLKQYLSTASEFDSIVWHLYHLNDVINAIPQGGNSYQIQKLKKPEATQLIIDFIKTKALDDFLFDIITIEPFNKELYAVSEIIPKMFVSFEDFSKFLGEFKKEDYKYLKEFINFYEALKEFNYNRYIAFKFSEIPIDKKIR